MGCRVHCLVCCSRWGAGLVLPLVWPRGQLSHLPEVVMGENQKTSFSNPLPQHDRWGVSSPFLWCLQALFTLNPLWQGQFWYAVQVRYTLWLGLSFSSVCVLAEVSSHLRGKTSSPAAVPASGRAIYTRISEKRGQLNTTLGFQHSWFSVTPVVS